MSQDTLIDSGAAELSLDDWLALAEDASGELVDGWLVEEEVPDYIHEILVIALGSILRSWILPQGGRVAGSDAKLAVSAKRGRKPDLTVFLPGRLPPKRGAIRVPPHIAVEIVSATPKDGRRDRVEKPDEYAAFGIPFYWSGSAVAHSRDLRAGSGRPLHARPGGNGGHFRQDPRLPGSASGSRRPVV